MTTIGSYQAKTRLPRLLQRVAKGERFTITKHGVPVAELVPVGQGRDPERVRRAIEGLKRFSKGRSLRGLRIKDLIGEGRR